MRNLVIGAGEVGQALALVLDCEVRDDHDSYFDPDDSFDIIHIAFPYQVPDFVGEVQKYEEIYSPEYTIVHSTVKVGTCDPRGWIHSPVRGKHPDLEKGLRTFAKHYGGHDAQVIAEHLAPFFPQWVAHEEAATTELGKLFELNQYGIEIVMQRYAREMCRRMNLPFEEVYWSFSDSYNAGWIALGMEEFTKPVLDDSDGPIGGHCVVQGAELLNRSYRNLLSEVVMTVQKELKGEL